MSGLSQTHAFVHLLETDATWRLLRGDNAPIVAALLSEHLGSENRRLPSAELYELIDHDLDILRAHGFELPQRAQGYCAEWRKAGFLHRRATEEARGETFELTPAALGAIRFLEQLAEPRSSVTESRLASIAAQLGRLAVETDPDATRRLEQLHAERARIDAQIDRIHAGDVPTLGHERALERVHDILAQAEEIPSEFARVRERFESLNRDLRSRIVESTDTQRTVLDEVFRGVDLIADSAEGRSFAGFSALVLDPVVGSAFDDDIARILDRDFATTLTAQQRRFLRRFIGTLKRNSGEIHDVITAFARGLRRYVQSQDYQRDRVLRDLLRETLAQAIPAAKHTKPYRKTGLRLDLSAVPVASVGGIRLHDPSELDATAPIVEHVAEVADLEVLRALARETEIDFGELIANVNSVLAHSDRCSVGDVLSRYPATQGVASVVGLLALAAQHGTRPAASDGIEKASDGIEKATVDDREQEIPGERVHWRGTDGVLRSAGIPIYEFAGRVL